jgi:membrane-anchored protein YejM (alkaline phosphatase superfamily)
LLNELKAANYHSCFFSSSPLTDRTQYLLSALGFDSIYCRHQITRDPQALDRDVFSQLLQRYANTIKRNEPYFVHIKNDQSHPPYATDAAHARAAPFDRFRHNIAECDQVLPDIVGALSGNGRDTLIIYTSDHGQSFGEYGYYCHSTSIIKQQTEVPFLIHHPKLRHRRIARSSHFDCLPTICDLLGLPIREAVIGHSLGHETIPFSHVVYSEAYCGNLPTCFGHINEDRKLMLDLNFNRYLLLDQEDRIIRRLDARQTQHSKQVLYAALQRRGLVDRPLGALL